MAVLSHLVADLVGSGIGTFGSGFVPIGKTVGTFCVWYVPVKCFLGRLGTNRCHFVPTTLLSGTNRCLFVPVVSLVPSARTARGVSGSRRPVLSVVPVVSVLSVGAHNPERTYSGEVDNPETRKEPTPGRWQGLLCICSFCQCSSCSLPAQLERFCLRR